MILLMGHIDIPPDRTEELAPAMQAVIAASRQEKGCLAYTLAFDPVTAGRIVVAERWRDAAALEAHGQAAHMGPWRAAVQAVGPLGRHIETWDVPDDLGVVR